MAVNYMTRVYISNYDKIIDNDAFEYDETLATGKTSNPIIIPDNIKSISVVLDIDTASGKVQYTLNKLADVISDTDVVWQDWDNGTISTTADDVFYPVTAIRFTNASGTATRLMLRAQ